MLINILNYISYNHVYALYFSNEHFMHIFISNVYCFRTFNDIVAVNNARLKVHVTVNYHSCLAGYRIAKQHRLQRDEYKQ